MQRLLISTVFCVICLFESMLGAATDPVNGEQYDNTTFTVKAGGTELAVHTYEDMYYVTLPWTGPVFMSVTCMDNKPIEQARIRPVRLGIPGTISQSNLSFQLDEPHHLVISIDKLRKLVIVPQLPDPDRPDLSDAKVINVQDIGADATGKMDNTAILQKAIDDLPAQGTLYFPAGLYRTGSLNLKSDMTLYVDDQAVIKGSDDFRLHQFRKSYLYFIKVEDAQNVRILGHGTIDANGGPIRRAWQVEKNKRKVAGRNFLSVNVKNLTLKNITFRESYSWNVHFVACDNLHVDRVKVFSSMTNSNGDGLDIDGCDGVLVENCLIFAEDDAITPKIAWTPRHNAKNFVIRDCVLWSQAATGIRLGAEASGDEYANMLFENIDFLRANTMIRIYNYDWADMHDIVFRNLWIEEYTLDVQDLGFDEIQRTKKRDAGQTYLFYIYMKPRESHVPVGIVRDVLIENIHTTQIVKSKLFGLDRLDGTKSVRNITFKNYRVNGQCMTDPKTLMIGMEGNCEPAIVVCD
ncbi:MAG TPA: hypothetical protein DER01_11100 [Phycisphaerales bacterium]|nr:hypothetical protein [Phycisphaerales bacterium]